MDQNLRQYIKTSFDKPGDRFINRELSWLAFNRRVVEEAENKNNPLLERVKFLAISASNLNEFYMVRIAGLHDQIERDFGDVSLDGLNPKDQLIQIIDCANELKHTQQQCWLMIRESLREEGVHVVDIDELEDKDKLWLEEHFTNNIFPALTPIAVDAAHPFPFLPNLGLALVVNLKPPDNVTELNYNTQRGQQKEQRAVVPLPAKLDRFITLPTKGKKVRVIRIEDVIGLFHGQLFPGYELSGLGIIRIIRDSELDVSDEAEDLLRTFETAVKQRRRGDVIHLEISSTLPGALRDFVIQELDVAHENVEEVDGILGLVGIEVLYNIDRPDLKYPPYDIRFPERINDFNGDCFAAIKKKDIVVHHPYESFDVVVKFIHQAAADPNVVAIKQTLYRTSNDSPIVHALIEAAEAGKSVTVVVELKARFDEEANIRWGRNLERVGAQVVYGVTGLKTHCKISLIVRQEEEGLMSYVHYGTGNYHPMTAKIYTDLSYFTSDKTLCRDAVQVFNYLTGYSPPKRYKKVAVAPLGLRATLVELIDTEIAHAKAGRSGSIWAKMNSLVDADIIDKLYEASQAGVKIDLVIRGICCLRPGIKDFSDNITVKSIVGRFLEHARIFCFGDGQLLPHEAAKIYISSADWMPRNLDRRVELIVPIENKTVHAQILDQIMVANFKDEKQSWVMQSDGTYQRLTYDPDSFSAHEYFMNNPSLSGRGKALRKKQNKPKPLS